MNINKYLLISAHGVTKSGNALHDVVFVLLALNFLKDDSFLFSVVLTIKFIPYLFFGYIGGIVADRYNKKIIMIFSDITRLFLVSLLAWLTFENSLNVFTISVIAFFLTLCRCFYQPAQQSIIPSLVRRSDLTDTNSKNQIAEEIGTIVGPVLAGLLIVTGEYWQALVFDCLAYVISLSLVVFIKYKHESNEEKNDKKLNTNIIKYICGNEKLFDTIFCSSVCILFISAVLRLVIPIYLVKEIFLSESYLGWVMGVIGFGTVLGAYLYKKMKIKFDTPVLYWGVYGLITAFIFAFENEVLLFTFAFLLGVVGAFVDICLIECIQKSSNTRYLGKTFSVFSTLANTGEALSNLFFGFILLYLTAKSVGLVLGVACVFVSLLFFFISMSRKIKRGIAVSG